MRMFVLVCVLAAALAPAGASATGRGHVRLVTFSPLLVRGTGFKAHEKFVVTVRSSTATRVVDVSSSATGAFMAQFARALPAPHCGAVAVIAVGAQGDKATWKSAQAVCGTLLAP